MPPYFDVTFIHERWEGKRKKWREKLEWQPDFTGTLMGLGQL